MCKYVLLNKLVDGRQVDYFSKRHPTTVLLLRCFFFFISLYIHCSLAVKTNVVRISLENLKSNVCVMFFFFMFFGVFYNNFCMCDGDFNYITERGHEIKRERHVFLDRKKKSVTCRRCADCIFFLYLFSLLCICDVVTMFWTLINKFNSAPKKCVVVIIWANQM